MVRIDLNIERNFKKNGVLDLFRKMVKIIYNPRIFEKIF